MKLRLVIRDEWGGKFDSDETWPGMRVGDVMLEAAKLLGEIDDIYKAQQKDAKANQEERAH